MLFGNEVTNSLQTSLLYKKIFEIFHDLYNEFRKIIKKYSSLKKDHALLSNEFDTLKNTHHKCNSKSFIPFT